MLPSTVRFFPAAASVGLRRVSVPRLSSRNVVVPETAGCPDFRENAQAATRRKLTAFTTHPFHAGIAQTTNDFYKLLDISRSASNDDIQKACYQVLGDDVKRNLCDLCGVGAFGQQQLHCPDGSTSNHEELHRRLCGAFTDVGFGVSHSVSVHSTQFAEKELSVTTEDECPRCKGTGYELGTKVSKCLFCNGTGKVFRWFGGDIHSGVSISMAQAILGATVPAQDLHGPVNMVIPPGCHGDQMIQLHGRLNSDSRLYGDHYMHMKHWKSTKETDILGTSSGVGTSGSGSTSSELPEGFFRKAIRWFFL